MTRSYATSNSGGGGGGGSQTPWTSDINGATYNLTNVTDIEATALKAHPQTPGNNGDNLAVSAGDAGAGGLIGGDLLLNGGSSAVSTGGNIILRAGTGAMPVNAGFVQIASPNGTGFIYFDPINVTGVETFTFPNASGTFALTSDLSGLVPYTGATTNLDMGVNYIYADTFVANNIFGNGGINLEYYSRIIGYSDNGTTTLGNLYFSAYNVLKFGITSIQASFDNTILTADRNFLLPDNSGTVALTSDIPSLTGYVPYTGATGNLDMGANVVEASSLYLSFGELGMRNASLISFSPDAGITIYGKIEFLLSKIMSIGITGTRAQLDMTLLTNDRNIAFQDQAGTIALLSDIPVVTGFVPYTGATLDLDMGTQNISAPYFKAYSGGGVVFYSDAGVTPLGGLNGISSGVISLNDNGSKVAQLDVTSLTTTRSFNFPDNSGTIALTSDVVPMSRVAARVCYGF